MKIFRKLLHYWFAFISVLSFLGGWAMLAHSLKPIQPLQTTTTSVNVSSMPNLPPIQAFGSNSTGNSNGLNFTSPSQQQNSYFPVLRTGGS
jgi:hypothetical protein